MPPVGLFTTAVQELIRQTLPEVRRVRHDPDKVDAVVAEFLARLTGDPPLNPHPTIECPAESR